MYSSGIISDHQPITSTKAKRGITANDFKNISHFDCFCFFVFLLSQAHGVHTEGEVVYVPFPLDCKYGEGRKYM